MEIIKNLITRLRHTGVLLVIGLILIIYISLGFVYWQQGTQQGELEEQITQLSLVISRPLPSDKELRAELERVNSVLAPMTDVDAIDMLVDIAEENGIDVSAGSGKFSVPSVGFSKVNLGGGTYQLISFGGIHVQGDYDDVMAFISDLDSGKTLKTMVLRSVRTSQQEVTFTAEEGARRAEFSNVEAAVIDMMVKNGLATIPNPMSYSGRFATNLMGDDPDTEETDEGFPDPDSAAGTEKATDPNGDAYTTDDKDGYVLYQHDVTADNSTTPTVNYIATLTTSYYYTCEANGTVRQFDGANVGTATEYTVSEESGSETTATVSVVIYTKPEG